MSRTVADATRFTATSPHAYSKPTSILRSAAKTFSPSTSPSSPAYQPNRRTPNTHTPNPPPPQNQPPPQQPETPQQKVARIRALRAAQKLNSLSLWDRIVIRGRRYADLVAAGITIFSLTDMIMYNRAQHAVWHAAQQAIYDQNLQSAIAAEKAGRTLTEEEQNVLNRERMVLKAEAEREQRKKRGWGISKALFGGMDMGAEDAKEEKHEGGKILGNAEMEGRDYLVGLVQQDGVEGVVEDVTEAIGGHGRLMTAIEEKKREGEKPIEEVNALGEPPAGGPLDRMAEGVAEKAKSGWGSWFGGR
ncbi:MAG: hypothetical protein Q9213_002586 [Squamulea squamosa]